MSKSSAGSLAGRVLFALLAIATLYTVISFSCGIVANNRYEAFLTAASGILDFEVKEIDYRREIFSSTVTAKLDLAKNPWLFGMLADRGDEEGDLIVTLTQTVGHGPLLFSTGGPTLGAALFHSQADYSPRLKAVLDATFSGTAIESEFLATLLGRVKGNVSLASGVRVLGNSDLRWSPVGFEFESSSAIDQVRFDLHVEDLGFDAQGKASPKVNFRGLRIHGELDRDETTLWFGTSETSVDSVAVTLFDDPVSVQFRELRAETSQARDGDVSNATYRLLLPGIDLNDVSFGSAEIASSGRNLGIKPLKELGDVGKRMQLNGRIPGRTPGNSTFMVNQYMTAMNELLAFSPELEIDPMRIDLKEGALSGRVKISFDGNGYAGLKQTDFRAMLARVSAEFDLSIDEPALRKVAELLMARDSRRTYTDRRLQEQHTQERVDDFIESISNGKFLVREADKLAAHFRMKSGRMEFNGQTVDPLAGKLPGKP